MHVPLPVIAIAAIAVLAVGFVFVMMMLAAVRLFFAVIELFGGLLLVAVVAFIVWKLLFASDGEAKAS